MKRLFIIFIVFMLLLAVLPCFGDYTSRASWEEQIHGMGYLILHLSSINAINGMNLTPDQARRLGQMAHEVEAISKKTPDFETNYRPDLAEVRDTYLEVRKYIISGKEVPGELAADLKRIGTPKKELDNRQQGFMNALFLFIPGSSEVYDNIIKRLDSDNSPIP